MLEKDQYTSVISTLTNDKSMYLYFKILKTIWIIYPCYTINYILVYRCAHTMCCMYQCKSESPLKIYCNPNVSLNWNVPNLYIYILADRSRMLDLETRHYLNIFKNIIHDISSMYYLYDSITVLTKYYIYKTDVCDLLYFLICAGWKPKICNNL